MTQSFTPRERTEEFERVNLSVRARRAAETKGRDRHEEPDPQRTVYQQDRERIVVSPPFGRLAGVSVGLPLPGPAPTALSETLSVAQTSRALARSLRLNEDLVEAIALGSHLGEPPFGSAGRVALAGIAEPSFRAGEQALRVVEQPGGEDAGLNLTFETMDGILHFEDFGATSLEGQLVSAVGRFHDLSRGLDRALAAGLVQTADVPTSVRVMGGTHALRIDSFADDVVRSSADEPAPAGSPQLRAACDELAQWRAQRLENHPEILDRAQRAIHCLRSIAVHETHSSTPVAVVDLICSLTEPAARRLFEERFLPGPQHS